MQHRQLLNTEHKIIGGDSNKVHDGTDKDPYVEEVAPYLPEVLSDIAFDYTDNDFPNQRTQLLSAHLTLFNKPFLSLESTVTQLGNMILCGEEYDVKTVLNKVGKYPELLDIVVTASDPLGTPVTGTLLQIAAMAGDVDLASGITSDQKRGLVERLAEAGKLSKKRVAKELECITSDEAKKENAARVECYCQIINTFMKNIYTEVNANEYLRNKNRGIKTTQAFREKCSKHINRFKEDLRAERDKKVHSGFVFDLSILQKATQCYKKNVPLFDFPWNVQANNLFWVVGFGSLQSILSSRDAQVMHNGIYDLVQQEMIPQRTLKHAHELSYFSNPNFGCFVYLNVNGSTTNLCPSFKLPKNSWKRWFLEPRDVQAWKTGDTVYAMCIEKLILIKNKSIAKFTQDLRSEHACY